ncbi:phytanoyl-CoA dioxygenase family protein [Sphingobium yanoikuyae]|uniref:phytanoyl-CoA dioxygenase family protein n=1 Tax=Sphingobium yanoikuyae TaxID=13690 RepID=UPI0028A8A70E|nr:phytanoyl-CoA dioxygenase family protein [Sphingobium yanoikuyae]
MTNIFPGLPLIESPLFPKTKAEMGLNAEEERIANDLHEKGYAILGFPDHHLEERIERIKARLGPHYGINFADPASDKTNSERRIQDAWQFDEDVRAIAANQVVLDLLSKLYGRRAFPFQTLNFPVGTQQDAHTDFVHFSSLPERFMCGVWLAMEDISPDSGPLFYYPGSHRWPAMTNALVGRRGSDRNLASAQDPYGPAWRALCDAYGAQKEIFLPLKGQAVIWSANLLHGGCHQNNPTLTRWSQVTHYYFDDCIYYTPAFSDEAVGQFDLRNLASIADGARRPNRYLGENLPDMLPEKKPRNPNFLRRFGKAIRHRF